MVPPTIGLSRRRGCGFVSRWWWSGTRRFGSDHRQFPRFPRLLRARPRQFLVFNADDMNPNSPGHSKDASLDDDIELLAVAQPTPKVSANDEHDYEEESDNDEAGLLDSTRTHNRTFSGQSFERAGKAWHQVRSIVAEVSLPDDHFAQLSLAGVSPKSLWRRPLLLP